MGKRKPQPRPHPPVLGTFVTPEALWDEAAERRLFPSENSARWFLRMHRDALVSEGAICIHTGRVLVDPAKVELVAQKVALEAAKRNSAQR